MQIPSNVGITIAANGLYASDAEYLKQFPYCLLICTWPEETAEALATLHNMNLEIRYLRFMNDPTSWPSFDNFLADTHNAVFANEPDIEGPPQDWVAKAENQWRAIGGKVMEPAWSDDGKASDDSYVPGVGYPNNYDIHTAHCYAGNWANANHVAGRCDDGRPVVITEYGRANQQSKCLVDIATARLTNDVVLYTLRWVNNPNAGYDLIGVTFE